MKKIYLVAILLFGFATGIQAQCGDLFFSEYLEGSSSNKALEIYNPTGNTVNLTDYTLYRFNNGDSTASDSLFPQGTLAAGDVFLITNPSASLAGITSNSDTTHTMTFFNGDDAIVLVNNQTGDTLDAIGEVGVDPGSGWTVGSGATNNFTLVRMIGIQEGTADWAVGVAQWDVFAIDTDDSLGVHSMTPCATQGPGCSDDIFFSEYIEGSSSNKALEIYNPMDTTVDLSGYVLYRFNNGIGTATDSLFPQGMLASADVFVIGNPSGNAAIVAQSDTSHTMTFYNGDDALVLINRNTGDTLDAIGRVGEDPGTNWPVGTGATSEFTLVRKFNIRQGNPDWTTGQGEWDVFPQNTTDSLGMHSMNPCGVAPTVPEVQFASSNLSFDEDAGQISIDILITSPDPSNATTVEVVLGTGTATLGNDFTYSPPTLITFPAGSSTAQSLSTIIIVDDTDLEGLEFFTLELQNPTNGALIGSNGSVQVNIVDNEYPTYPIGTINTVDADGVGDSIGVTCFVGGIVYGVNMRPSGLQFTMIGSTGGIGVFDFNQVSGYTVQEGDSIILRGTIGQFNGLLQMDPDSILLVNTGNTLKTPDIVTQLGEFTESNLVVFEDAYVINPAQWTNSGSGFNVDITNGTDTIQMRVDADVTLYALPAPLGKFDVCGLGGQFDSSNPYTSGYQLLPRYTEDMKLQLSVALGNDTLFCGDSLVLDAGATDYQIAWSTGDTTQTIVVDTAGTYIVTVSDPGYGQSVSDTIFVDPSANTQAAFMVDTLANNAYQFIDQSVSATSWAWDFGDGATSTMQNPLHTYIAQGVYTVTLIASSPCGTDTAIFIIDLTVGLEDDFAMEIGLWPNPNQGMFSVELPEGNWMEAGLTLRDALGRMVWKQTVYDRRNQVGIQGLDAGMYFLEVELEGRRGVIRMMIQ